MAKYTVSLSKKAQKQLDKLSDAVAEPIFQAIEKLGDNPNGHFYHKHASCNQQPVT